MRASDNIDWNALPLALGAVGLGIATIAFGDFALQPYAVPPRLPARQMFAVISAAILIGGGVAAIPKKAGRARLMLATFYALWVVVLDMAFFAHKPSVGSLLVCAEPLFIAAGAVTLLQNSRVNSVAAILAGLCAVEFGIAHFVYSEITADMVPAWIPARLFWAYFCGAAHIAAGVAILTGNLRRLAATLLAAMCGSFFLLVHVPRVAAAPDKPAEWTMFCIALSIAGAAWLIRCTSRDEISVRRFFSLATSGRLRSVARS